MNVGNAKTLIAYLEGLPPEAFHMYDWFSRPGAPKRSNVDRYATRWKRVIAQHTCGTAACIAGHANIVRGAKIWYGADVEARWLGLGNDDADKLFIPRGVKDPDSDKFTLTQAIATLRRMVGEYERAGKIVIDWSAPQAAEVVSPPLPGEITSLLRPSLAKTEA